MNKNIYILLLILIVEIYSTDLAKVCHVDPEDDSSAATNCQQDDCNGEQTELATPAGADTKAQCYTPRAHCQTYHTTNDECDTCESDAYKVESGACVCKDSTYERFPATGDTFNCYTKVDHCQAYHATNDECTECDNGYTGYPAGSGPYTACKTTREHCQAYHATNDECDTCESNIYKLDGNPKACVCNTGYTRVPTSGNPFKCYTTVTDCDSTITNEGYNPNYDACYKCSGTHAFTSDHSKCVRKIQGCKKHSSGATTTCEECYTGSDATSGESCACTGGQFDDTLQICKKIANCNVYNSNAECTKCDDDHVLSGGKCETACTGSKKSLGGTTCFDVIDDCETYNNDYSKCVGCTVASSKSVMKGGTNDGKCVTCDTGDLVSGADGNCYSKTGGNVANCAKYEGTTCVECKEHMKLDNGACIPCYHPLVTLGKFCAASDQRYDEYCTAYGEDGYCSACSTGYAVDGSHRCVKSSCSGGGGENNENKDKPSETTEANNASCVKLNVLFVVLLLSIFW